MKQVYLIISRKIIFITNINAVVAIVVLVALRSKKGKVSYKEMPLAFIQPDEILLCCCHVESDLEIDL